MDYLPKYDLEIEVDPEERLELSQDFSVMMDESSGESIDSVVVTAQKLSDSSDVTGTVIIDESERIRDEYGQVAYGIDGSGLVDNEDYAIEILASTNRTVGVTSPRLKSLHLIKARSR